MARKFTKPLKELKAAVQEYDVEKLEQLSNQLATDIRDNIAAHPTGFVRELTVAVSTFNKNLAGELCKKLLRYLRSSSQPYALAESKEILELLRRKRYFDLMIDVADVFIQTGQDAAVIRRQYAQALLDKGLISAALNVLQLLEEDCLKNNDQTELAEIRGLMGRAQKQIYINAVDNQPDIAVNRSIENAISTYTDVYEDEKQNIWHGVNSASLITRANRDKINLSSKKLPDAEKTAKDILKQITVKKDCQYWDFASAAEANLVLEDYKEALNWIIKYTKDGQDADAFEYASTLRQFEEVLQLDDHHQEQAQILHLLRAALLRQDGGRISIDHADQKFMSASALEGDNDFEQILGKDRYKSFQWYRTGLERATGVAQILDRSGVGIGTGFLLHGEEIHPRLQQQWVLITNSHVISDSLEEQNSTPASLPVDEVRISFEGQEGGENIEVNEILFTSPRNKLDFTVVSLDMDRAPEKSFPIAKRLPLVDKNQRIYVIGHPRGGGLAFSIDDNLLLDHEKSKVHYRAPTEGGSSGSPVFNQQWDLIALHHAGGMNVKKLNGKTGTYPANEGISFQSIRDAVATQLD